jgi:hypothetical protein
VVFNDDFIAQHGQPDVILPIHLGRNAGCNWTNHENCSS